MPAEDYMVTCLNKRIFGIECFGCGTQRALLLLWEGKFGEAFYFFPAVYPLMLFFMILVLKFLDKKRNYSFALLGLAVVTAVVMVVSYFFRPDHPLS